MIDRIAFTAGRAARWVLMLCAAVMLAAALDGGLALAQSRSRSVDSKIAELENKVALLESEVAVLRERLETLVGKEPGSQVHRIDIGESPVLGAENAPLTLVMFGDYQSDYTARAQHAVKRLLEAYPQRVRFVYKHYPLSQQHPLASEAALAALAAERQGRFWEYHEQLFRNARRLDGTVLLVLAEQVGLDLTRFERDRRSLWALERLGADEKLATSLEVAGLPTLFLNGRLVPTWRYDVLQGLVEKTGR